MANLKKLKIGDNVYDVYDAGATRPADLTTYATKTYVDGLMTTLSGQIANAGLKFELVTELPTRDISTNTIYLTTIDDSEDGNIYKEWMYVNNKWELIGSVSGSVGVDLDTVLDGLHFSDGNIGDSENPYKTLVLGDGEYAHGTLTAEFNESANSSNPDVREWVLPSQSGTLATTDDIPDIEDLTSRVEELENNEDSGLTWTDFGLTDTVEVEEDYMVDLPSDQISSLFDSRAHIQFVWENGSFTLDVDNYNFSIESSRVEGLNINGVIGEGSDEGLDDGGHSISFYDENIENHIILNIHDFTTGVVDITVESMTGGESYSQSFTNASDVICYAYTYGLHERSRTVDLQSIITKNDSQPTWTQLGLVQASGSSGSTSDPYEDGLEELDPGNLEENTEIGFSISGGQIGFDSREGTYWIATDDYNGETSSKQNMKWKYNGSDITPDLDSDPDYMSGLYLGNFYLDIDGSSITLHANFYEEGIMEAIEVTYRLGNNFYQPEGFKYVDDETGVEITFFNYKESTSAPSKNYADTPIARWLETNLKTVNGQSLLGVGENITAGGSGSGGGSYTYIVEGETEEGTTYINIGTSSEDESTSVQDAALVVNNEMGSASIDVLAASGDTPSLSAETSYTNDDTMESRNSSIEMSAGSFSISTEVTTTDNTYQAGISIEDGVVNITAEEFTVNGSPVGSGGSGDVYDEMPDTSEMDEGTVFEVVDSGPGVVYDNTGSTYSDGTTITSSAAKTFNGSPSLLWVVSIYYGGTNTVKMIPVGSSMKMHFSGIVITADATTTGQLRLTSNASNIAYIQQILAL